ncbi:LytTR family DNA-binding domain-containing protein [Pseudoduganella ginsengisoli]|uniref:Response regulator n=1 Tax=Pseudoduganella ginsengisoli TaxID=1462440 RepID=A0A6L6PYC6_9BURK|nr:LytTR family DNA-binding domain-containing protein [Pseudoduganella ginsengisoli]MTW01712.1 response regulator [Pseudoduganella ginsengisoli]
MKVLIVDDEAHARTNLRLALQALPEWRLAAECASAAAARAWLASDDADIVLLDVQMPVESGLAFARELSRRETPPLVVFVTAHRGHALEAFDVHALDYIVKPVDEQRLQQALQRAATLLSQRAAYVKALNGFMSPPAGYWTELAVRSVGRIDRVCLSDVRWMETAGNYVELHLPQRTFLHRTTLSALERYLDPEQFIRIHRRILVRRSQMLALQQAQEGSHTLTLACGARLPVSETYVAAVKAALMGK